VLNLASNLLIYLTTKVGAIDAAPKVSAIHSEHLFAFERRAPRPRYSSGAIPKLKVDK